MHKNSSGVATMHCLCLHVISRPGFSWATNGDPEWRWWCTKWAGHSQVFSDVRKCQLSFLSSSQKKLLWCGSSSSKSTHVVAYATANGQVEEPDENSSNIGDKKVQEILVGIVRLQADQAKVTEFVDERAKLLSDIAEQAKEEYDKIAEEAMRTMDEARSKVLENVEAKAQAIEEELASARAEIEANDQDLDEFEKNVSKARSEGLFFKDLYSKPLTTVKESMTPEQQELMKEQTELMSKALRNSAVLQFRQILSGVVAVLLILTLGEAVLSQDVPWPNIAFYSLVLVAILFQLGYEKLNTTDSTNNSKKR